MYLRESLAVAALAAAPVLATSSSVNVYWGQQGNGDLATACQDPSVDYITLGFVNISPENGGPTEYPGTNFGAHCWAEKYSADGHTSELLSTCPSLTPGIAVCQSLGKKVLLSIGGVYGAYSNYTVSTPKNGAAFAEFVWGAFGPYTEAWAGKPRPFDDGNKHNAVDGFDFDLESSYAGDAGYAAMITTLRGLITVSGRSDIITAAPQCPLEAQWQTMAYLLQTVQFDRLWIQFYNNPQCSLLNADGTPNPGFNYAEWEKYLANTPSRNAKLHIGLPGSPDAAGSGYVDASVASTYLCKYGDYPMFGGVMVWDQWFAAQNTIDGASYNQVLYESMKCGCKACPVPTSTISTSTVASSTADSTISTSTIASSTADSTSLSTVPPVTITSSTSAPPASTPTCTGLSGWDKEGTNIAYYADAASATYSGCLALCDAKEACLSFGVLSAPACALYDYAVEGNVVADAKSGNTFYNKGGVCAQPSSSSSVVTSASETTVLPTSSTSIESSTDSATTLTTSSAETASTSDASSTEVPPVTSETEGVSISSTTTWSNITWTTATSTSEAQTAPTTITTSSGVSLSTRPPHTSWSNTTWTSHGSSSTAETIESSTAPITSTSVATEPTGPPSGPGNGGHTATSYSTTVVTVTSCAPTVSNCPGTPHVTTSIIPITSTVSPTPTPGDDETVTATVVPITSTSAGPNPGGEHLTTSTIYSTTVYTVTSCAPAVTDCPGKIGSVTTQTIAISTTVCPVTEGGHTAPTPPAENGGGNSLPPSETKPAGSNPPTPGEGEGSHPSPSAPAGGEGSYPSPPEGGNEEGTTISTVTTKLHSTITLPVVSVPTAGNEGYPSPPPVNNPGVGPSHGFGNGTATRTLSLATVKPTGAGVPVPQTTAVTAGAAKGVVSAGLAVVAGVMVFML